MDDVNAMNGKHAVEFDAMTKEAALDLLERNSAAAAAAIRALSDEELNRAATASGSDRQELAVALRLPECSDSDTATKYRRCLDSMRPAIVEIHEAAVLNY